MRSGEATTGEIKKIYNHIVDRIKPVDLIVIFYSILNLFIISYFRQRIEGWPSLAAGFTLVIVAILLMVYFYNDRYMPLRLLRNWYPLFLSSFFYPSLGKMNHFLFQTDFDPVLIQVERMLFGSDLSLVFVQNYDNWAFYELMHLFYFFFYLFPFFVGVPLYLKRKNIFDRYIFVLMAVSLVEFLFFISFPAGGPKFGYSELAGAHLPAQGPFSFIMHQMLSTGEIAGAAFPSNHVTVGLLSVLFASGYLKRAYANWLWLMWVGLVFGTVYLQQHYAIDALAGALFGTVALTPAEMLYKKILTLKLAVQHKIAAAKQI